MLAFIVSMRWDYVGVALAVLTAGKVIGWLRNRNKPPMDWAVPLCWFSHEWIKTTPVVLEDGERRLRRVCIKCGLEQLDCHTLREVYKLRWADGASIRRTIAATAESDRAREGE